MLALTVGTMLLVYGGLYAIVADMRENIQTLYEEIRTGAEQTIEEGLYAQDSDSLGVLADMQMEVTDSRLRIVSDAVRQSAEFAERLYASPASYLNSRYDPVHLSKAPDTLSARYMFSAGVKETDALYNELRRISNMEEIFTAAREQIMEYPLHCLIRQLWKHLKITQIYIPIMVWMFRWISQTDSGPVRFLLE